METYQEIIRYDQQHKLWVLGEGRINHKFTFIWGVTFKKIDQLFILTNHTTRQETTVSTFFPMLPFAP